MTWTEANFNKDIKSQMFNFKEVRPGSNIRNILVYFERSRIYAVLKNSKEIDGLYRHETRNNGNTIKVEENITLWLPLK